MMDAYEHQATALLDSLKAGDVDSAWRFKWQHPAFRGHDASDVRSATLDISDARLVIAREHAFETWEDLTEFVCAVEAKEPLVRFETAADSVISGDLPALRTILREYPELVKERSVRSHHATLLHYIAANGVEGVRQTTPANAVDVARALLDAGAEVDALADMYDAPSTTLSMLVSSSPPAEAGLQGPLTETLLDYGAAADGPFMTALAFGFLDTANVLARRGARLDNIAAVAGLGLVDETSRLLPVADARSKQIALGLAAQLGHAAVVRLLLDAGENPDRYNLEGFHAHSTPLHQAVAGDQLEVVRLLVERGARVDIRDTLYQATPLAWAVYNRRTAIADYLRGISASSRTPPGT
jgi:ankyrin repeat protein